jgi:ATP-dependent Clp protease protease subunit
MKQLYLDNMKKVREISLYIQLPRRHRGRYDGDLRHDAFRGSPIATYCIGRAQSGGAVILAAGTKGSRYALPHAKIMLHQPWGGVHRPAPISRSRPRRFSAPSRRSTRFLAKHTGQAPRKDPDREPNGTTT